MDFYLIVICLATTVVATLLYKIIFVVLPWIYKVRVQIYNAVVPFAVVKPHWLLGHVAHYPGKPNDEWLQLNLDWMAKSKNGAFAYILPLLPNLTLCHPDTVKKVLKSSSPKGFVPATGRGYLFIIPWLREGLLTSKGEKWIRDRKLITPSFHFEILKKYVKTYNECVDILLSKLEESSKDGNSVEIYGPIEQCTLNVILRCAFSSDEDVQHQGESIPYVKAVKQICQLIMERVYNPLFYFDCVYKLSPSGRKFYHLVEYTYRYARHFVEKRKEQLLTQGANENTKVLDFLDTLLLARDEEGNGLTDDEMMEEISTFLFGGHDTTGTGISWILYHLAQHPDIQKRAREEVDGILDGREEKVITHDDLSKLEYVTRCIKESLRITPPVMSSIRELTSPLEIGGQILPAGTVTECSFYCVHHNPEVWGEDHMKYDPDRFLPENMAKMDPFAYLTFSAGPRNCVGQHFALSELITTISRILHKFEFTLDTSHKVTKIIKLTTQPENGIKMFFRKRY